MRVISLPDWDVRTYTPPPEVRGILAAPPCTEFALSGAKWWKDKPPELLAEALEIFDACMKIIEQVQPKWWAVENPVGRLRKLRSLGKPTLSFNPCDYGDPWNKRTLVWGEFNLPTKTPVEGGPFPGWTSLGGKSERTKRLRSITPPGFAQAFFEANP